MALVQAEGIASLTYSRVAAVAETTRQAVYRRFPNLSELTITAIGRLADADPPPITGEPLRDLIAEMRHFRHGMTLAGSLPLSAEMLNPGADEDVLRTYREVLVAPRRARIRQRIQDGIDAGQIPPDADVATVATMLTGSWYELRVSGATPPRNWAQRVSHAAWRAAGGTLS